MDEEVRSRVERADARQANLQASICIARTSGAAQPEGATVAIAAPSGRASEVTEAGDQRFPGAMVEAIAADPGSAYGKLSGSSMAIGIGSHIKNTGTCKQKAKLDKEIRNAMMKLVAEDIDVSEIYSPPGVAVRAKEIGLRPGWSLDLTTKDKDGKAWDFSKPEMRNRAIDKIGKDKPLVIIGSPMFTG